MRRGRSSRRAARRGPPRRGRRRRLPRRTRAAAAVNTSNWVASSTPASRTRETTASRSASSRDADPLGPADDVRREVGADTQSLRGKQRLDHPHGCRLAVRADHVDGRIAALRMAEPFEERTHPAEAELLRPGRERPSQVAPAAEGIELTPGSGRASRARPRRPRPAHSRRSARCRASPRPARPPCGAAPPRPRGSRRRPSTRGA